jgi:hypothetical protein
MARRGLVLVAAALVLWVRILPLSLPRAHDLAPQAPAVAEDIKAQLRYRGEDGREHVYLGDYDSYVWVRHARNYLRSGTTCDATVAGTCRDTYANAPVGRPMLYGRSLHIVAIVALHRAISAFVPGYPLLATAFWVPVAVGLLGVPPAFGIGWRMAGPLGGLAAAVLVGVEPVLLKRSIGGDNDVWNVVLPLWMVWAAVAAVSARGTIRQGAYAALAAVMAGAHAGTWRGWVFTYAVVLVGFVANAALIAVQAALGGRWGRSAKSGELRGAILVVVVFVLGAGLSTTLAGSDEPYLSVPRQLLRLQAAAPAAEQDALWPDAFRTVTEVKRLGTADLVSALGGPLYVVLAWLGLVLLWLPRDAWRWRHGALAACACALYAWLATAPLVGPTALVALLALPLAAAALSAAMSAPDTDESDRGAAAIVTVWLLAALLQAPGGMRFIMLLGSPLAIAFGVTLGRLETWLGTTAARRAGGHPLARAAVFVALAAVLVPPFARGVEAARAYLPVMHDAWWETLTDLRQTTPPEAIVDTWWDYGHWVKYVAERRVSADGASLRTRVPYWIARALLAPTDRETFGLLRMLNCGSDTTPEGAYGKLRALGLDELAAHAAVVRLAGLDRPAARAYLSTRGLSGPAVEDVLESTHCVSPPAYLVLSSALFHYRGFRHLGSWDPRRAYVARIARRRPAELTVAALSQHLGLGQDETSALLEQARALRADDDVEQFIAPDAGYLAIRWFLCDGVPASCTVNLPLGASGAALRAVRYDADAPLSSRLELAGGGTGTPALMVLAGPAAIDEVWFPDPTEPTLGVLVDLPNGRILLGPPYLIRSTFTRLMILEPPSPYFQKVGDRFTLGERVVTWRLTDP